MSRLLGVNYDTCFKEWVIGRAPIPLGKLESIIRCCDDAFQAKIKTKIDSMELRLSCKYSAHKVAFPRFVSKDLAYAVGLILGDGTLAGNTRNADGNWLIAVYFDNVDHLNDFDEIVKKEFGINPIHNKPDGNCHDSYFCSKVVHWFFRTYFGMSNGFKANKILAPPVIFESTDKTVQVAFLQGLFDSDGTITRRGYVQYASTSETMVKQVQSMLLGFEITNYTSKWLKNEKVLPLYSVVIASKQSVLRFSKLIGFRHPLKKERLAKFSLVV